MTDSIIHEILQIKESMINQLGYTPEKIICRISKDKYDELVKFINDNYNLIEDESLKDHKGLVVFGVNVECWEDNEHETVSNYILL